MPERKIEPVRLRRLNVRAFKAVDHLEIEFPQPVTRLDPDILVLGSKNGLGKTSILEACAVLFIAVNAATDEAGTASVGGPGYELPINPYDLLIRAGQKAATISGTFLVRSQVFDIAVSLSDTGRLNVEGDRAGLQEAIGRPDRTRRERLRQSLLGILGFRLDPFISPPFMYFHSYRKVQEGNPELGAMVEDPPRPPLFYRRRVEQLGTSRFKLEILRSLMSQARLFENVDEPYFEEALSVINRLMLRYAGGTIRNLRPLPDNTVEFRIQPVKGGAPFTFDGLSSGQKEIISTLFLIWRHTHQRPGVVLIDEPELHLNVEWHRNFIRDLHNLVPDNQYIVATHSEDVFASVDQRHRMLLLGDRDALRQ